MKLLTNNFVKKLIITLYIVIMLTFFVISPSVHASKVEMSGDEFYYTGTTKGTYVVSEPFLSWFLNILAEIADFLLGLMTMGVRMVFVGWTALFEIILTAVLEGTTGIPMDFSDTDSTSVEKNTSSSNNVTVEAIVYNQVPIFNVNLFEKMERPQCVTGTGNAYVKCDTCAEDIDGYCKMDDCKCDACLQYMIDNGYKEENAITIIKDSVSSWYYMIRLMAAAAMLLIFIALGIKLAITSSITEKALYKKMLVDWLVGLIIIFAIHYIMIWIISFNETIIDIVKDIETGVVEVTKKELRMDEKTDKELEISIYEAVRTRAYDPKLINGMTGMLLYISLVFLAFKYSFIYAKRYLTIIILTIMAPAIGFSYALQRVLTGKSPSFSTWLQEYFVNVFIQSIHAIIYTTMISTALVISLNSVSGMIVALVIMNFSANNADKIFRKIFKMSGEISNSTTEDPKPKEMLNNVKSAAMFMSGNKLLQKSPITKAVTKPFRALGTGAAAGASMLVGDKLKKRNEQKDEKQANNLASVAEGMEDVRGSLRDLQGELGLKPGDAKANFTGFMNDKSSNSEFLNSENQDAMEAELRDLELAAEEAYLKAGDDEEKLEKAQQLQGKLQDLRKSFDKNSKFSTARVLSAHLGNYFADNKRMIKDNQKRKSKYKDLAFGERMKTRMFGEYDASKHKRVKTTLSSIIKEQTTAENLLGITSEDQKMLKEMTGLLKETTLGIGSTFLGMANIVVNPTLGFALLGNGMQASGKFLEMIGAYSSDMNLNMAPRVSDKNRRYKFNRFNKGAKANIVAAAVSRGEAEKNRAVVQNVQKNHKTLYRTLKFGGLGLCVAGGIMAAPITVAAGATAYAIGTVGKRYRGHSTYSSLGKISKHHFKQYEKMKKELIQDGIKDASAEEKSEFEKNLNIFISAIESNDLNPQEDAGNQSEEQLGNNTRKNPTDEQQTPDGSKIVVKQEQKIIMEAVVETLRDKVKTQGEVADLSVDKQDYENIKKIIETKLKSQPDMKIEDIIDIDSKIETATVTISGEIEKSIQSSENNDPIMSEREASDKGNPVTATRNFDRVLDEISKSINEDDFPSMQNNSKKPSEDPERIAKIRKAKKIRNLETALQMAMNGEFDPEKQETSENKVEDSKALTNDVLEQLFKTKEERAQAMVLIENVNNMRKINRRGERAKMQSKSKSYLDAKDGKQINVRQDGSKIASSSDGSKRLETDGSRAVVDPYGPVIDIVELMNSKMKEIRKEKI